MGKSNSFFISHITNSDEDFQIQIHSTFDRHDIVVNNEHSGWSYADIGSGRPDIYELVLDIEPLSGDIDFEWLSRILTPEEKGRLLNLWDSARFVIDSMDNFIDATAIVDDDDSTKREQIARYVKLIETLEFAMQGEWGIRKDANYHTWWLKSRHCTCPKMDNTDPAYFGHGKIINNECPVHGHKIK